MEHSYQPKRVRLIRGVGRAFYMAETYS
ncbi:hypothetical protein LINGRAHAP2_LOCUS6524 [Linum grandiflorum]